MRNNWASTRPRLSVVAEFNIRGNLKVDWAPLWPIGAPPDFRLQNTTGLKDEYFSECFHRTEAYGPTRPAAELLWFRNVPLTWHNDHPAVRFIIYTIHSRYQQILRDVRHEIEVVEAARFEFLQDDNDGVQWTLV